MAVGALYLTGMAAIAARSRPKAPPADPGFEWALQMSDGEASGTAVEGPAPTRSPAPGQGGNSGRRPGTGSSQVSATGRDRCSARIHRARCARENEFKSLQDWPGQRAERGDRPPL